MSYALSKWGSITKTGDLLNNWPTKATFCAVPNPLSGQPIKA